MDLPGESTKQIHTSTLCNPFSVGEKVLPPDTTQEQRKKNTDRKYVTIDLLLITLMHLICILSKLHQYNRVYESEQYRQQIYQPISTLIFIIIHRVLSNRGSCSACGTGFDYFTPLTIVNCIKKSKAILTYIFIICQLSAVDAD